MVPLPPHEQRHPFIRYQGLEYTNADIAYFEERLERIYSWEIHRVQVVDFWGMLELIRDGLFARMVMKHRDDAGVVFILAVGLHTEEEMKSPGFARCWSESERMIRGKGDLHDYWRSISTDGDLLGPLLSYTLIRDPMLRLCHRMMAHSIAWRSQAPEKVTVIDLFYLRGLDVGSILGGLTVIAPELPIINMGELVRLQICMEVDDTWAWVAMGPKRQLDAMTGAHGVA
ncbi:hypothetical protein Tco_0816528 [Tanacetum coccineum]